MNASAVGQKTKKILQAKVFERINPSCPDPGQSEKIYLKFYFKGLHKTFWGATKKCENKYSSTFFQYNFPKCTGRQGLRN